MLALSVAMACAGESADSSDTAAVQTSTAAPSVTNACTLVPATEVSAVIGETVRDSLALNLTDASGAVSLSQCNYASATNAAAASLMLRKSAVSENVAGALQSGTRAARELLSALMGPRAPLRPAADLSAGCIAARRFRR